MRHRNAGFKLGRNTSHRRALLRNLVTSVIEEDRVETTLAKAKAVRPHIEKMITLGKKGDLHSRRQALAFLRTDDAVKRLFDVVAPRYGDRNGGYLRIVRTGFQQGDGAEKAFIELLGAEKQLEVKRQKRADLKAKKRAELEKQLEEQKKECRRSRRRRKGRVSICRALIQFREDEIRACATADALAFWERWWPDDNAHCIATNVDLRSREAAGVRETNAAKSSRR